MEPALRIENLTTGYGQLRIVRGLSLTCASGELTVLLGRNGAGKTTTLAAVAGLLPIMGGVVSLDGTPQTGSVVERIRSGLGLVQDGKRIFRSRTVEENLRLGGFIVRRQRGAISDGLERAYSRFPVLKEKRKQSAGALSGGQQQMLAIAQALMPQPRVLMLDEPSAGLAPSIVEQVFDEMKELTKQGLCVLLVEQLVDYSLAVADNVAVLDRGHITINREVASLGSWDQLRESYLGADLEE
ncbi:ABC transporter ATP-binding protein [Pseudonocardia oroxyli]|uniref:ABC transporter ATP-binding protein n=1 Tax=Pseudonocardia oroxyli TaxID=366584 RepID=UPI000A643D21|nr:ABC transporter ATP-binding protein [Pseudonocardia oroxyli]